MSLQELRTEHLKDICIPMLIAALLTTAKLWEQPKCSLTGGWIKNMWCVCVCIYIYMMNYYSATRKKEILPYATTWMNHEGTMLSEISQKDMMALNMWNQKS